MSDILAFPLDIMATLDDIPIEDHIGECANPVTKENAARGITKGNIFIDMAVSEYKAVDIGMLLQIFPCKQSAILLVYAHERRVAINLMLEHAMSCPAIPHPHTPPRMNH